MSAGQCAGSRQVWSSAGWVTLKPECWERAKHSLPGLLLREPGSAGEDRDRCSHIFSSCASLRCATGAQSRGCAGETLV